MTHAPSRPRIGVDFHTFDGIFQGSRSHLLGLYQAAIPMAHDLDFLFMLADTDRLRAEHPAFQAPNVQLARMPHRNGVARLLWQLPRMQATLKLDLMHVQYRLPLWTHGPCLCTIHDVLFESHPQFFSRGFVHFARWTSRDALRRAAAVLTVSEYSRQQMSRLYGLPSHRIGLTPNGVDTARFHPAHHQDDQAVLRTHGLSSQGYLCTIGRLEPRKNHLNLVRAYASLPVAGRPPLIIVGQRDFAYEAALAEVDRLGLQESVRFLESVGDAELPVLLRHAAVFAYPTWAEGFGMPVLEAMASGVSVVTSDNTSLPEVAGDVAFLCRCDDVTSIAAAMAAALQEAPARRADRHARGVARAQQFNWERSAQSLIDVIRQVLPR